LVGGRGATITLRHDPPPPPPRRPRQSTSHSGCTERRTKRISPALLPRLQGIDQDVWDACSPMNAELAMALGMLPAYIPSTVWDDIPGMNLSKIANAISDVGGMCLMAFHCYVRGIRMCCPVLIHNVLPSWLNCQGYISIVKPFLDAHQVALGEILQRAAVDHRSVPNGTYLGCYPFLTHQEVQAPSATKKKKRSIKESDGDLRFDESNVLLYALLDRRLSSVALDPSVLATECIPRPVSVAYVNTTFVAPALFRR
jgi:hypothetical protein